MVTIYDHGSDDGEENDGYINLTDGQAAHLASKGVIAWREGYSEAGLADDHEMDEVRQFIRKHPPKRLILKVPKKVRRRRVAR